MKRVGKGQDMEMKDRDERKGTRGSREQNKD